MYSREKEDDMETKLIEMGFKLVEDTGRRKKFSADRIFELKDCAINCLVVDHKSTHDADYFELKKQEMDKLRTEALKYDKEAFPVMTISFHKSQRMYIVMDMETFERLVWRGSGEE